MMDKRTFKCPKCGKELPLFFRTYTKKYCHEIHVSAEKHEREGGCWY